MVQQGSKIELIISVAGHQVTRNLSEHSEFTVMHLVIYAENLRQAELRTESRAVRALLTTGGTRIKKLHERYLEVYGQYQVVLKVDGICNSRLLQSHMRLKKKRPYNHWLKSQGHYLLCFSTSRTVGANSVRLRHETRTRYSLKATTKISPQSRK